MEYNKYNHLHLSLPGFKGRPYQRPQRRNVAVSEDVLHQQRLLLQTCDRLKACVVVNNGQNSSEMVEIITQLGTTFTKLIELMLSKEIKVSVESLEETYDDPSLKLAIDAIITLALEGNHLCRLIAKHGGVRALLTVCVDPKLQRARVSAFRALGTVCCVLEGIMELEEAGGIEILSDTLRDSDAAEEDKSEAAGLLAQITSPWIENNSSLVGLGRHLPQLVESLTGN